MLYALALEGVRSTFLVAKKGARFGVVHRGGVGGTGVELIVNRL